MGLEIDLAMVGRWFLASVTAMVVVGPAIVWLGGGWYAITAGLQVGVIVAFVSFIQGRLYGPAAALAGIQVQIVSALAVFERIFDYLDISPKSTTRRAPSRYPACAATSASRRHVPTMRSRECCAASPSTFAPAKSPRSSVRPARARRRSLSSFRASTIRSRGRVLVDGHDVRTVTLESLRRDIGIVTQETYLFHDTIARNLRYGKPDATDAELHAAAARRTSTISSRACPTVTKPSSASAGTNSPAASVSASPSRACCSKIRASSSSTKRRARSIPKTRRRFKPRSKW